MNKSQINRQIIELKSELQMYKDVAAYKGYDNTRKAKSGDTMIELIWYNSSFKYTVRLADACSFIEGYANFEELKCFKGWCCDDNNDYLRAWTIKCIKDIKNEIKSLKKMKR